MAREKRCDFSRDLKVAWLAARKLKCGTLVVILFWYPLFRLNQSRLQYIIESLFSGKSDKSSGSLIVVNSNSKRRRKQGKSQSQIWWADASRPCADDT